MMDEKKPATNSEFPNERAPFPGDYNNGEGGPGQLDDYYRRKGTPEEGGPKQLEDWYRRNGKSDDA